MKASNYRIQKLARQLRAGTARIVATSESTPWPYWVIDDIELQVTWHVLQRRKPRWGQMYGIHEQL